MNTTPTSTSHHVTLKGQVHRGKDTNKTLADYMFVRDDFAYTTVVCSRVSKLYMVRMRQRGESGTLSDVQPITLNIKS